MNLNVWKENGSKIFLNSLNSRAIKQNRLLTLPDNLEEWEPKREKIRKDIWKASGVQFSDAIDLDLKITKTIEMDGYKIQNIVYQSRSEMYVTGNLYIPEGEGPFPGVIVMHGHYHQGKIAERVQARGHTFAANGYVALCVDAFGSGERTDIHGDFKYHGYNLGSSLIDIGETLLGAQVVDNMRGVSLLCSLPFVDKNNIGATGASGGGNQTMWLSAMDDRVKAAVPVVSVGTFESYINAVNCICECLPGGLNISEEGGVLALVAPRAIKICNALLDSNITFFPSEMLRSYNAAKDIFRLYGSGDRIANEVFNTIHGYWPIIRESMLGWFARFLKGEGDGSAIEERLFETLPEEDLMVFAKGKRPNNVIGIGEYCIKKAKEIRASEISNNEDKVEDLKRIIGVEKYHKISATISHGTVSIQNRILEKTTFETNDGMIIPALISKPLSGNSWLMATHPDGKSDLFNNKLELIDNYQGGIIAFDLPYTGELELKSHAVQEPPHANVSRALWWFGTSLMAEWIKYIHIIADYMKENEKACDISYLGIAETATAGLFAQVIQKDFTELNLLNLHTTATYDICKNNLSMGHHIMGIIPWGDIDQARKLVTCTINIIDPVKIKV